MRRLRPVVEVRLRAGDGRRLAELHRTGEIMSQATDGDEIVLTARLDPATVGRLRRDGVPVS